MDIADLVQTHLTLTRPLVRFFLIGIVLFVLEHVAERPASSPAPELLEVPAAEIDRRTREWTEEAGRLPNDGEQAALIDSAIDEEVLFRTALHLRLHESDGVVSRRLVQNMRFLGADPHASDTDLRRQAFTLGMEQSDVVVRRRLVERMEEWLRAEVDRDPPNERAVDDYIAAHPDRFAAATRVAFTQVLVSGQAHGAGLESAALRLLAELRARRATTSEACAAGDPSLLPCDVAPSTKRDVERFFGSELAADLMRMPTGVWAGPLRSPYGLHLVRVRTGESTDAMPSDVRAAARVALRHERREQALREERRALRGGFVLADRLLAEVRP